MHIVVTGSDGFLGKNLRFKLQEKGYHDVTCISRQTDEARRLAAILGADIIFHLAAVNRPESEIEFETGNAQFTETLCKILLSQSRSIPIVFASSSQAVLQNAYGVSKRKAEIALEYYGEESGAPVFIFRLPNVFGKWSRPNYNSAIATFCNNIARGLPIKVNDHDAPLELVYIDDVVDAFLSIFDNDGAGGFRSVEPKYQTTVGQVADIIRSFAESRTSLVIPEVGTGLVRALYSTYVSHLPVESFAYQVPIHADPRGTFSEILKTAHCGQFSYFTAHPGVTRGEHYHHSKTEKFAVIRGKARFHFRHIQTEERYEIDVVGGDGYCVETVPGWAHAITNVGDDELIVMLWANEIFDKTNPDTIAVKVVP